MESAVGDKREPWTRLEIGTSAWAAAKMKDPAMSPEEREKLRAEFKRSCGGFAIILAVGGLLGATGCTHPSPEKRAEWVVSAIKRKLDLNDEQKAKLDYFYSLNMNIILDYKIILLTCLYLMNIDRGKVMSIKEVSANQDLRQNN